MRADLWVRDIFVNMNIGTRILWSAGDDSKVESSHASQICGGNGQARITCIVFHTINTLPSFWRRKKGTKDMLFSTRGMRDLLKGDIRCRSNELRSRLKVLSDVRWGARRSYPLGTGA